jgi:hypothetical protein
MNISDKEAKARFEAALRGAQRAAQATRMDAMTPEEALRNILILIDGSDEMEDVQALQILLQSIKTLAEKGLGRAE